jgi:hypothetical protein
VNVLTIPGVDPTGNVDCAPALQAAVDSFGSSPVTLYFPPGTYKIQNGTGPVAWEECVRITSSVSLQGVPGQSIITDGAGASCGALFGYFSTYADYSFEDDFGYAVVPSSAGYKSPILTLSNPSDASHYAPGQWVYLRGTPIPQPGEYHGEPNQIVASDVTSGTVTLRWPLSSDFTQDSGLRLNLVADTEVIQNLSITGLTWNFHNQNLMGAQTIGMDISNNVFNCLSPATSDWAQFNQNRQVTMTNNVFNGSGVPIDPSRNPIDWLISGNTINGANGIGAGEYGANVRFINNTITASPLSGNGAIGFGGIYGGQIQGNTITASGSPGNWQFGIDDANGAPSPHTQILNNILTVKGISAMAISTDGTVVSGNTIYEDSPNDGITFWTNNAIVTNNTWILY